MVGEFLHIERFLHEFRRAGGAVTSRAVTLGPGDDAAIMVSASPVAVTTDALFENVHFRHDWGTWEQVGHKALAVNLSDLAAMGARPLGFTCALGLPPAFAEDALAGLARGMGRLAARHDTILAGGNFARASEVSVTITAFGALDAPPLRRDGARPGDAVLLAGNVGIAGAELRALRSGGVLPPGQSALLEPQPLIESGLLAAGQARCAIDISDGLVQDLEHVARASAVRIRLDYARVPVSPRFDQLTEGLAPHEKAHVLLAGGEDYALVVVAPLASVKRLARDLPAVVIGQAEEGRGVVIDGAPAGVDLRGHDHFRGT